MVFILSNSSLNGISQIMIVFTLEAQCAFTFLTYLAILTIPWEKNWISVIMLMLKIRLMLLTRSCFYITSTKFVLRFLPSCSSKTNALVLFVIRGVEKLSSETTTSGNPVAMAVYVAAIIPLILIILVITDQYPHGISKASA